MNSNYASRNRTVVPVLLRLFRKEELAQYLQRSAFLLDPDEGVLGFGMGGSSNDARSILESSVHRTSTPGRLECLLADDYWVEKIEVSRWVCGFMVCPRNRGETNNPLDDDARRLEVEAQSRWRKRVERDTKLQLTTCNSEAAAFELAGTAAWQLFGPETNSHAYHAFAAGASEALVARIDLIFADSQWCAPTVHPPSPSHVGYAIAFGQSVYEPDLRNRRYQNLDFHFVLPHEPTRTAFTVYLPLGSGRRGAFQSIAFESDAFPQTERDTLERIIDALLETVERLEKNCNASRDSSADNWSDGIVTKDAAMLKEIARIHRARDTNAAVLILGENGTGKELAARAVHNGGPRAGKPFIAVNCAAIPETLLEPELFGIERNVATGVAARKGKIELADEGTLFLDEVADLSLTSQAKVLRAIQEHEIERVGGRETLVVDFRIIAATNKDLRAEIEAGRFRQDLYYRLNVICVNLPPLRNRLEDIPLLAKHMIGKHAANCSKQISTALDPQVLAKLRSHSWPGNVRELENAIQRAVVDCQGDFISMEDLSLDKPTSCRTSGEDLFQGTYAEALHRFESGYFKKLLGRTDNKTVAAQLADLERSVFYAHLRKAGLVSSSLSAIRSRKGGRHTETDEATKEAAV